MDRDEPPLPFNVTVVAACGFDAPGLDDFLDALLLRLTTRYRHRPIGVAAVIGQPVCRAVSEVCKRHQWSQHLYIPTIRAPRAVAVLRESVAAAAQSAALVVLTRPGEESRLLVDVARWLGVPCRVVEVPG